MTNLPFNLNQARYISLTTFRRDGTEVRTPVWVAGKDGQHYVFSKATAGKMKRIRNSGKVRIALCDIKGKVLSDWSDASAEIITEQQQIDALYVAFNDKYAFQMRFGNWFTKLIGTFKDRGYLLLKVP